MNKKRKIRNKILRVLAAAIMLVACFVFDFPGSLTAEAAVISVSTQESLATYATTGGTINITGDIALSETMVVRKDLTIKSSGGFMITREKTFTGTMFVVNDGASLTINGNLTIDGGEV